MKRSKPLLPTSSHVTLGKVAAACGVSPSTVSRVINGTAIVSAEKQARVRRAVEELGFVPNTLARALADGRTFSIGLVAQYLESPFYALMLRGIEETLSAAGYGLVVASGHWNAEEEARCVHAMRTRRVDGIIVLTGMLEDEFLIELARELPVVVTGRALEAPGLHALPSKDFDGARAATRHLLERGHARIAYIGGDASHPDAHERERGYRAALAEASLGMDPTLMRAGDYLETGGAAATEALLDEGVDFTAIFAANDQMAAGGRAGAVPPRPAGAGGRLHRRLRRSAVHRACQPAPHHRQPVGRRARPARGAGHPRPAAAPRAARPCAGARAGAAPVGAAARASARRQRALHVDQQLSQRAHHPVVAQRLGVGEDEGRAAALPVHDHQAAVAAVLAAVGEHGAAFDVVALPAQRMPAQPGGVALRRQCQPAAARREHRQPGRHADVQRRDRGDLALHAVMTDGRFGFGQLHVEERDEGLAGPGLQHHRHQAVAGVGIEVVASGHDAARRLLREQPGSEDPRARGRRVGRREAGLRQRAEEAVAVGRVGEGGHATAMVEQLLQGHDAVGGQHALGQIGQRLGQRGGPGDLAALDQARRDGGGHGLGRGADLEEVGRADEVVAADAAHAGDCRQRGRRGVAAFRAEVDDGDADQTGGGRVARGALHDGERRGAVRGAAIAAAVAGATGAEDDRRRDRDAEHQREDHAGAAANLKIG
ncbi:periplasmic binding proteins and sugar binding domain of lacI family domain-containing protein [Ditylenchus destructor]|nr:periplasmic binding proteins and sugar binding domain of lacI family domain-containing protein [Ditylenchus destructor]